ncbi:MAG: rhomboid family intramembrane serine protease [Oscillospiraceae bacterium]|nr:rhomboid family intramembrane serine protease [Oscillospiraceae bacterium]
MIKKILAKFQYNAPVILTFTLIALLALLINNLTNGWANLYIFSVYRTKLLNPMQYVRLFTHVIGHADYAHLINNFTMILLVGPMLEEKYGSKVILKMILFTACITGIIQIVFFPNVRLLGASGILFMLILLSSFANFRKGRIPLTLVFVAVIYLAGEIVAGLSNSDDNVSHLAHIIGGLCGTAFGWFMTKPKAETPASADTALPGMK